MCICPSLKSHPRAFLVCISCYPMSFADGTRMECDKPIVRGILEPLIDGKVDYLFSVGDKITARYFHCMKHWFLCGLPAPKDEDDGPW